MLTYKYLDKFVPQYNLLITNYNYNFIFYKIEKKIRLYEPGVVFLSEEIILDI